MAKARNSRKVIDRATVAEDLELHVTKLVHQGQSFIEIRNFIPSLGEYGRGVTFPAKHGERIIDGVAEAVDSCST